VTTSEGEAPVRSYRQYCGIARAADLVGERWAVLVIRDLILGPKRFTDLLTGLPGIATNVLTQRLKELERAGVVRRRTLPPPAASTVYELTEYGRELEPVLLALGRWGAKSLGPEFGDYASRAEWFAVALKAYFRPEAAAGVHATVAFELDGASFHVAVDDGELRIAHGAPDDAELTIACRTRELLAFLRGDELPAGAAAGDMGLLRLLPRLFALGGV
jgi:DNA-binding HxlR family transcriptional regulator